ncbi:MAG: pyridoxal-phosphate dependent enzyme [candidate division Zixibacteria bacterium]|nr:pyridoxal-phosphate dependent enzyme [candidate division Zixibacteria bacterium]
MKLSGLPRVRLANLPTPLQELPNLSRTLKGPRIFVKRDDMTGLAFGGNKTRKLEYLMPEALRYKADYIVTGAGFHSNWCTQTAAAARRLGMKIVLIKTGPKEGYDPEEYDGNHLLHFLQGAQIKVAQLENVQKVEQETMEQLKAAGQRPYLLTATGSTPPGAAGYINAMLELLEQSVELGINIDYLVHATGSGGTQSGLIIGAKAFNTNIKIIGSTTGWRSKDEQIAHLSGVIEESLRFLQLDLKITEEDIIVYDHYAGGGYGFITEGKAEAIKIVAEAEGLFIDPVYTASAMACLIDLCREGFFKPEDVVVFLHTGGSVALFPYKTPIKAYASGEALSWTIPPWSPLAS